MPTKSHPALVLAACVYAAPALAAPAFDWPVACRVGESCEIQHYVDHGNGGAARDYACGSVTYGGHNGTDIRLPTMLAEKAGVDILAAAPGRVLRVRDGMLDMVVSLTNRHAIQDRECGNGLVIQHADGFETQYCHMAQGSLVVRAGDNVAAGQKLGHVGLSGNTEFPHLHITFRKDGKVVDPFAYGAPAEACGGGTSLWNAQLTAALRYKAGAVLNAGFAQQPVTMDDIENGAGDTMLRKNASALLAFVRAITLRKGDIQRLTLTGPGGELVRHEDPPLASNKDQVFLEIGRKMPPGGWPAGTYAAVYSVTRAGRVVVDKAFEIRREP